MNQILFANENGQKKSMTVDINKIIKFFCIFVIILGLGITTIGAYSFITINSASMEDDKLFPEIDIQKKENHIYITITHAKGKESVKYQWNDAQEHTINGSGRTQISEILELPAGTNILNLTVRDVTGQEIKDKREFISESEIGPDVELPEINISPDGKEVRIVATDETEISYLTYQWENQEEIRVDVTDENKKTISINIPVLTGENLLIVKATDASGNTRTDRLNVNGIVEPTIEIYADENTAEFVIKLTDEMGLKILAYDHNGKKIKIELDGQYEVEHRVKLQDGTNTITVYAFNIQDSMSQYTGIYDYNER